MKKLSIEKMENLSGGTGRGAYCASLGALLAGGGYQGDISYGWHVYFVNCTSHGFPPPTP